MALVAVALVLLSGAPAAAADDTAEPDVEMQAVISGQDVADADSNQPVELSPDTPAEVQLVIANNGSEPVLVRSVRLDGSVMGLTFFSFETVVGLEIEPGAVEERTYELDLVGLEGQATGLMPAEIQLLDQDRSVLASEEFVADVRGSFRSVYTLFGLAIAGFTALTLAACLIGLARHELSANRFRRGLQFMVPGIGIGLTLTFTLSALRIVAPSAQLWLPITLVCAAAMFVVGYLSPGPDGEHDDDDIDGDDDGAHDEHDDLADDTTGEPAIAPAGRPVTQGGLSDPPIPQT